jgi:hypothetical protein
MSISVNLLKRCLVTDVSAKFESANLELFQCLSSTYLRAVKGASRLLNVKFFKGPR